MAKESKINYKPSGRFNMADPAKLSPAMQFSIRCAKAEAQRDALLSAAELALPWVGKAPHGVQPDYEHAYAALSAAVAQARGAA